MEYWKLNRLKFVKIWLLINLVSIAVLYFNRAILATINRKFPLESRYSLTDKADFHLQTFAENLDQEQRNGVDTAQLAGGRRTLLGGPGSSPPRCISKCGRCTPCRPVHVPVPPGTPVTAEYYPEAWRCKCGNKLYMPRYFI